LVDIGTKRHFATTQQTVALGGIADIGQSAENVAFDPYRNLNDAICGDAKQ
jgi:hypothetical protein